MITKNALFEVSFKLLLTNSKGEALFLKTNKKYCKLLGFDLPGGRIETKEISDDFSTTLNREIKEELGDKIVYSINPNPVYFCKIKLKKSRHKPYRDGILYILFEGKYKSGIINVSKEHESYKWTKLNKKSIKLLQEKNKELMKKYF